jgi:heme oxygenase
MSYRGEPLSVRLRAETRAAHDAAQRSGFLGSLAAGRLPFAAYADLTAQHWFVYEALELAASAMADDPVAGAFVAHHYTRYLGDLSGGQYLGPAIARSYGLDTDGHRFFVFDGVDPFAFKAHYRHMLDNLNWPRSQERIFLSEVGEAYRLNTDLLDELKERWT